MLAVHDRQMMVDDREWVAIDRVVLVEWNSPFFGIEVSRTKETRALRDGLAIDRRRSTRHAMGNVSHVNVEPVDMRLARLRMGQALHSTREARPRTALIFK